MANILTKPSRRQAEKATLLAAEQQRIEADLSIKRAEAASILIGPISEASVYVGEALAASVRPDSTKEDAIWQVRLALHEIAVEACDKLTIPNNLKPAVDSKLINELVDKATPVALATLAGHKEALGDEHSLGNTLAESLLELDPNTRVSVAGTLMGPIIDSHTKGRLTATEKTALQKRRQVIRTIAPEEPINSPDPDIIGTALKIEMDRAIALVKDPEGSFEELTQTLPRLSRLISIFEQSVVSLQAIAGHPDAVVRLDRSSATIDQIAAMRDTAGKCRPSTKQNALTRAFEKSAESPESEPNPVIIERLVTVITNPVVYKEAVQCTVDVVVAKNISKPTDAHQKQQKIADFSTSKPIERKKSGVFGPSSTALLGAGVVATMVFNPAAAAATENYVNTGQRASAAAGEVIQTGIILPDPAKGPNKDKEDVIVPELGVQPGQDDDIETKPNLEEPTEPDTNVNTPDETDNQTPAEEALPDSSPDSSPETSPDHDSDADPEQQSPPQTSPDSSRHANENDDFAEQPAIPDLGTASEGSTPEDTEKATEDNASDPNAPTDSQTQDPTITDTPPDGTLTDAPDQENSDTSAPSTTEDIFPDVNTPTEEVNQAQQTTPQEDNNAQPGIVSHFVAQPDQSISAVVSIDPEQITSETKVAAPMAGLAISEALKGQAVDGKSKSYERLFKLAEKYNVQIDINSHSLLTNQLEAIRVLILDGLLNQIEDKDNREAASKKIDKYVAYAMLLSERPELVNNKEVYEKIDSYLKDVPGAYKDYPIAYAMFVNNNYQTVLESKDYLDNVTSLSAVADEYIAKIITAAIANALEKPSADLPDTDLLIGESIESEEKADVSPAESESGRVEFKVDVAALEAAVEKYAERGVRNDPKKLAFFKQLIVSIAKQLASEQADVNPSVMAAQGAIETGWGKYAHGNNLFGIKAGNNYEGDVFKGSTWEEDSAGNKTNIEDYFRAYDTPEESVADRLKLADQKHFENGCAKSPGKYLDSLQNKTTEGPECDIITPRHLAYATSVSYKKDLLALIKNNNLEQIFKEGGLGNYAKRIYKAQGKYQKSSKESTAKLDAKQRAKNYSEELGLSAKDLQIYTDNGGWFNFRIKDKAALDTLKLEPFGGYPEKYVKAPINAYADEFRLKSRQCVSYAAYMVKYHFNKAMPTWGATKGQKRKYGIMGGGHANGWIANAKAEGYEVTDTPQVGSILAWQTGEFGHVAPVHRVLSDGAVVITEANKVGTGEWSARIIPREQLEHPDLDPMMNFIIIPDKNS